MKLLRFTKCLVNKADVTKTGDFGVIYCIILGIKHYEKYARVQQKCDDLFMGKYIYMKLRDETVFLTRAPRAFKKDSWIKNTIYIQDKFSTGAARIIPSGKLWAGLIIHLI